MSQHSKKHGCYEVIKLFFTNFWGIGNPNVSSINPMEIQYATKSTIAMTDDELEECAGLFSSFYGKYSKESDRRPGQQIRMPAAYYRKNYCKPNFYVALARTENELIGQAFYLRKDYSDQGYGVMTWVLQLVVSAKYRRQGIASTLLRSIWGFSDDYAWGLATTNPCTVKTLESATFRKCKPEIIQKNLRAIKLIGSDISFVKDAPYAVSGNCSQINTNFYVDNKDFMKDNNTCEKQLGVLRPGYEWLAFTFCNQGIQEDSYRQHFSDMVVFSEKKLNEAYSRMDMPNHKWTKGTINEADFILQQGNFESILDLCCGYGRHAIELAKRGIAVTAVDFSEKNISESQKLLQAEVGSDLKCQFVFGDARTYRDNNQYDAVICLYDVVGSFPEETDNLKIIETAYNLLKHNGIFILSVMNMELTDAIVPERNKGDLKNSSDIIRKLPPSRIMQSSGDIFDPRYLAIDTATRLVYRKEQFSNDDGLSAEYIIRDKRYTMEEIKDILEAQGFQIHIARYVRAGHFDEELKGTDGHAKEICIVARKTTR